MANGRRGYPQGDAQERAVFRRYTEVHESLVVLRPSRQWHGWGNGVRLVFMGQIMKLAMFLAPLAFLMGASTALGNEVSFAQPADSRNGTHVAEKNQDFDDEWLNAELLAYEKRYEAEKTREQARKVENTIITLFAGFGIFCCLRNG